MLFSIISVKINSNHQKMLKNFLIFLTFCKIKLKLNLNFIHLKNSKLKKKQISVLKSPHVHKTAQEHFKIELFSAFFQIINKGSLQKWLIIFKNLHYTFLNFKFKFQFEFFFKKNFKLNKTKNYQKFFKKLNEINPNRFIILTNQISNSYLILFDIFGEINLNQYLE